MPELPEVETTKNGILPFIDNASIESIQINNPRLRWPVNVALSQDLVGQTIHNLARRGKYLIFECEYLHFIIHLGMSGSLRMTKPGIDNKKHDHIVITLNNQQQIVFNDPRRFGCFIVTDLPYEHKLISKLGPEPLSRQFHAKYLYEKCSARKVNIKQLIMDSQCVVGVGNIYANEALFLSQLHPLKICNTLIEEDCYTLVHNIKKVLRAAIKQGGTTLRDFINADGKPGYFQQTLNVYGRNQQPCNHCGTLLEEIRINGRSTVYCPECQAP